MHKYQRLQSAIHLPIAIFCLVQLLIDWGGKHNTPPLSYFYPGFSNQGSKYVYYFNTNFYKTADQTHISIIFLMVQCWRCLNNNPLKWFAERQQFLFLEEYYISPSALYVTRRVVNNVFVFSFIPYIISFYNAISLINSSIFLSIHLSIYPSIWVPDITDVCIHLLDILRHIICCIQFSVYSFQCPIFRNYYSVPPSTPNPVYRIQFSLSIIQ